MDRNLMLLLICGRKKGSMFLEFFPLDLRKVKYSTCFTSHQSALEIGTSDRPAVYSSSHWEIFLLFFACFVVEVKQSARCFCCGLLTIGDR